MSKDVSILENSISINGTILSQGLVDISGNIEGLIISDGIFVKDGGVLNGDCYVNEITLAGNSIVKGNVFAKKIKMFKGSSIKGTIKYSLLSIEDGVKVDGQCVFVEEEEMDDILENEKNKFNEKK